jgi:hypothetical protein
MSTPARTPEAAAAVSVLGTAIAMIQDPAAPTVDFLKHHHVEVVSNGTAGPPSHAHRAHIDTIELKPPFEHALQPLSATSSWPMGWDEYDALDWAHYLGDRAHCVVKHVDVYTSRVPPVVQVTEPVPEDHWQVLLYRAVWETPVWAPGWRTSHLLNVGNIYGASGCDPFSRTCLCDVVGCILPIRPQSESEAQLYRGELFCALVLLHRQLKRGGRFGSSVCLLRIPV